MPELNREVDAAVALLVDRYGDQARKHACHRLDMLLGRESQVRALWVQVVAAIDDLQERARVARWRQRAVAYRSCAEACTAPGSRFAYRALAECADSVADRMEDLQALRGDAPVN